MTTREFDGIRLEKVREHVWEIPREGDMNVPARVLASESLLAEIGEDKTLQQLKNATHLPGMVEPALCMPTAIRGTGSRSAASARSTPEPAVSRPERSAMT